MMAFRLRLIVALYIQHQKISTKIKFRLFLFRFSIYHIYIKILYVCVTNDLQNLTRLLITL